MRIGVAYYPEHWDTAQWQHDVALMAKAGVSVVRMGEFAWSRMEPEEGRFEFAFLDSVLGMMEEAGIACVLGTPTAAPPAWLHAKYPDIYPADKRGYRLGFGTRTQRCLNHPAMRRHSRLIVDAMATQFGCRDGVIGWQTDNELSANLCYCPLCHMTFHEWLSRKYGSLDALNRAWGTVFWSHEYSDWAQIPLPWEVKCGDAHNPSLQLAYRRFQSESTVSFQREQIDILRAKSPGRFVTHNVIGLHGTMDYYELARDLDFVSWDNYPSTPWGESEQGAGLAADVVRGIKQRGTWVMEQQNGIAGWERMGRRPLDAQLRCWAWQAIAHGADAVVFFRWRTCRYGTEQFWHGVLNHDGVPRRRYRAFSDLAHEVAAMSDMVDGSTVSSQVAILNAYDQHYALQIQPQSEGLGYWNQAERYYRAVRRCGLNVDIAPISVDLSQYRLVILPSWHLIAEDDAMRLKAYVQQGGTLVVSARSGVKDLDNVCRAEPLPALLGDLVGVEVDDYDPLGTAYVPLAIRNGEVYRATCWADALVLRGAESLAAYAGPPFEGEPAITMRRYGSGTAYYFGTYGEPALYAHVLGAILDGAGIRPALDLPPDVDASWRDRPGVRLLFLMNLAPEERTVVLPKPAATLLGAACEESRVVLPAYGVGVYQWADAGDFAERGAESQAVERQ